MLPPHRLLRPLTRAGTALLVSLGLVVGASSVATAAPGATRHPATVTRAEADADPSTTLTLAATEAVLEPTQSRFDFVVRVDNHGKKAIPAGTVSLEISPQHLTAASQLLEPIPELSPHVAEADLSAVKADGSQAASVSVRGEDFPLTAADPAGVYLMRATFTPDGKTPTPVTGTVPVVWRGPATDNTAPDNNTEVPTPSNSTQLGVIVPLVLPTSVHATPTIDELDEVSPRLEALLDVAAQARATIAIDPRIIGSIRAYGDDAPSSAQELLRRLETMTMPSFLLQFADADPAAQSAIGLTELLEPTNLAYLSRQGSTTDEPADETPTRTPSKAPDGAAEAPATDDTATPPELSDLLAWPQQTRPVAWPAEGQVDAATITLLSASGINDSVLSSTNVSLQGGPRASLGTGHAMIADAPLSASVRQALAADNDIDRLSATAMATSLLALRAQSSGGSQLLAVDRGAIADAEDPAALLKQLITPGWVTETPVASLPEGSATLKGASTLEERREYLRSAVNREADVNKVSVLLQQPEYLTGYQRNRLLNLFATRNAAADVDFSAVAAHYTERDDELRRGVQVVSTKHTQLVGTSTEVPLQLRNYLPFDATVTAKVLPISAALRVDTRSFTDVAVPADGNARVMVPVRTRVSTGETGIAVNVTDTAGAFSSDLATVPLTIRSGIEKVGVWVMGVLAALLLVFGTLRSIRRRVRKRAGDATSGEAATPDVE